MVFLFMTKNVFYKLKVNIWYLIFEYFDTLKNKIYTFMIFSL